MKIMCRECGSCEAMKKIQKNDYCTAGKVSVELQDIYEQMCKDEEFLYQFNRHCPKYKKRHSVIVYRVESVLQLEMVNRIYETSYMDIPALYVYADGQIQMHELEELDDICEQDDCQVVDL